MIIPGGADFRGCGQQWETTALLSHQQFQKSWRQLLGIKPWDGNVGKYGRANKIPRWSPSHTQHFNFVFIFSPISDTNYSGLSHPNLTWSLWMFQHFLWNCYPKHIPLKFLISQKSKLSWALWWEVQKPFQTHPVLILDMGPLGEVKSGISILPQHSQVHFLGLTPGVTATTRGRDTTDWSIGDETKNQNKFTTNSTKWKQLFHGFYPKAQRPSHKRISTHWKYPITPQTFPFGTIKSERKHFGWNQWRNWCLGRCKKRSNQSLESMPE